MKKYSFSAFILLSFCLAISASGQDEKIQNKPIKIGVDRVVVPITVTDEMGAAVTNLRKENLQLLEDKAEQTIISLEGIDTEISVGLVLDASKSMEYKWPETVRAATEFMRTANPRDEFLLVSFSDRPYFSLGFTRNTSVLQNKLLITRPAGNTALFDAIYLAIHEVKRGEYPRKAIVIISDGGDNHSRYNHAEIKRLAQESDVMIYAIGIYTKDPKELANFNLLATDPATRVEIVDTLRDDRFLEDIAKTSGGKLFRFIITNPTTRYSLSDTSRQISLELRNQYILTYSSTNEKRDGKWRKIKVNLNFPLKDDFSIRHREGYYAPRD